MACEATAVAGLSRLGDVSRWHVEWAHFWTWLQAAPLSDALPGLLRWLMLVLAWWLLATSVLYSLARLSKVSTLIRGTGWLTVPFVRFAVDRAVVVTLAASTVIGARAGAALAQTAPPAVGRTVAAAGPAPGWNTTAPSTEAAPSMPVVEKVASRTDAAPAPTWPASPNLAPAGQCGVNAGDNLWSIAAAHLAELSGRDVSTLAAADIAPYWWGVVDANRTTLRSGHPNLIYPGETVVLPAVVPTPTGWGPGSTVAIPSPPGTASASAQAPSVHAIAPAVPPPLPRSTPPSTGPVASPTTSPAPAATPAPTADVRAPAPPASTASRPPSGSPSPAGGRAQGHKARAVVAVNPWAMRAAMAGALGLPALALAGWLAKLRRGRINQASRARPGRDVVRTEPDLEPIERAARAITADLAEEWIDATLRALTASLAEATLASVPQVRCVRAGELGVEVLLAEPFATAPAGWEVGDGGHVWRVPPDVELDELRRRGAGHVAFAPALVSLGATPEGPILADVEGLGVLSVEGDAARVRAFLAGVALELHSASWAEGVDLRVYGMDGFGGLEGVAVPDAAQLAREAAAMAQLVADGVGSGPAVAASRCAGGEPCYPMVVVVGPDVDPLVVAELVAVGEGRSGVTVVGAGSLQPSGWQLVVGPDGTAVLKPMGLDVRMGGVADGAIPSTGPPAAGADVETATLVASTTAETELKTDAAPVALASAHIEVVVDQAGLNGVAIDAAVKAMATVAEVEDLAPPTPIAPGPKRRRRALRRREDCEVWVSVLRRTPEVTGWVHQLRGRRKLAEVFVYLAIYGMDRPVPAAELHTHCWPPVLESDENGGPPRLREQLAPDGFHQAVSRLRKQLGQGAKGWHLPFWDKGGYAVGAGVGCDWCLFQGLVAAAEAAAKADVAAALALYREALELVEGEPFADLPRGSFAWATDGPLVTDMHLAVAKAAHDAASLALPSDPEMAVWATGQGLLLLPTQLHLFDVQMTASANMGDLAGLERSLMGKCRAHEQLDPDGGVPPETMDLYRRLMARAIERQATAAP